MKKLLKFLTLSVLSINSTTLLTSCALRFGKSNVDYSNSDKELLEKAKRELEANLIDVSSLDESLSIESQKGEITKLMSINDIENITFIFCSSFNTLSQTNNVVEVEFCYLYNYDFELMTYDREFINVKVKFKNVKTSRSSRSTNNQSTNNQSTNNQSTYNQSTYNQSDNSKLKYKKPNDNTARDLNSKNLQEVKLDDIKLEKFKNASFYELTAIKNDQSKKRILFLFNFVFMQKK